MKKCIKCEKLKEVALFNKGRNMCKECQSLYNKQQRRTEDGLIGQIYRHQKFSSKKRNMSLPSYSLDTLKQWIYDETDFVNLYKKWQLSGFNKDFVPSVDRIDDYKPYSLDNIQLLTWKENNEKHKNDRKNGVNNKASKKVYQFSLNGGLMAEFNSIREADRSTGINQSSILKCCNGKFKQSGGFIWSYTKEEVLSLFKEEK